MKTCNHCGQPNETWGCPHCDNDCDTAAFCEICSAFAKDLADAADVNQLAAEIEYWSR